MRQTLVVVLLALAKLGFAGGAPQYAVSAIPEKLIKNANAVIRLYEASVDVKSASKFVLHEKFALTVFNESGELQAGWQESYSNLRSIDKIEGELYDAYGNKIKSLKKSEIQDSPLYDGISLANDDRIKSHSFHYKTYPYTVVYESEVSSSLTMFLPVWAPVPAKSVSVQQSRFMISFDKDKPLLMKVFNAAITPKTTDDGKRVSWLWELNDSPAYVGEYAAPSIYDLAPFAQFTMSQFKMEDFAGSLNSWKEYGQFIGRMRDGLEVLPTDLKAKIKELTANGTQKEKVLALYDYLQKHSHYISVQIGIGGWRPFPASYVASKGYGDCKALSNFMVAMLKEAGITGYYALINAGAGKKDINPDFPSPYFNHAICAVPLEKDTLWLECTSQTNPAGYSGSFTGNRHALLITENGGVLAATPRYTKSDNIQQSVIKGKLLEDGSLQMTAVNRYQGESSESAQHVVDAMSRDEQLKYIKNNLDIPNYEIAAFNISSQKNRMPTVNEHYEFVAQHYGQITGKRIFLLPNILNRWNLKLNADTARQYPINLTNEFTEIDSVQITIPNGYRLEASVKPLQLKSAFGTFEVNARFEGNLLTYYRKLERNRGTFPATQYQDLVTFYAQIYTSDRTKMVLVKME